MSESRIREIEGTITRADGTRSEFPIQLSGYSQWGADRAVLGSTVDLLSALNEAAREFMGGRQ